MLAAILIALGLWIGVGYLLLILGSRKKGNEFTRETQKRIYSVGENIEVSLRLTPPAGALSVEAQDIFLLIDHSSSMGSSPGSPLREAIRAASNFVEHLPENIRLSVIAFAHDAQTMAGLHESRQNTLKAIGSIASGGGTAIDRALALCRKVIASPSHNKKKTVILFTDGVSDAAAAAMQASLLREDPSNPSIYSIGFGTGVNGELMRLIAGTDERYLQVNNPADLQHLFGLLATAVTGKGPVECVVREGNFTPRPFRLDHIGEIHPIEVVQGKQSFITWALPLMNSFPLLTYNLVPECPGWHLIATPDSKAAWHYENNQTKDSQAPLGPRVLVLPGWLSWASFLFNPLFWMCFGWLWRCPPITETPLTAVENTPLPNISFPQPLPALNEEVYVPDVKPGLVIGIGEMGEWVACRTKMRLQDRDISPDLVKMLAIRATHKINYRPVEIGATTLLDEERLELHQDLRPYLEGLRNSSVPSMRKWIPLNNWLAEKTPLVTTYAVNDRRLARLALLLKPGAVVDKLHDEVRRLKNADGLVVVVGAPEDPEFSGLLGEIAHICAENGSGVIALLVPSGSNRLNASVPALKRELERMILVKDLNLLSDRSDPPARAKKLFDRVIVLKPNKEGIVEISSEATDFIWSLLSYKEVYKRIPDLGREENEATCAVVETRTSTFPARLLWQWIRERALSVGLNHQRLQLTIEDGRAVLPHIPPEILNEVIQAFWSGENCLRPQGVLLQVGKELFVSQNSGEGLVSAIVSLEDRIPVHRPYHEQVLFSQRERQIFVAYLEEWVRFVLQKEYDRERWGIQLLYLALEEIEKNFTDFISRTSKFSGNSDFTELVNFISNLYTDLSIPIVNLKNDLARWLVSFVGTHAEVRTETVLPDRTQISIEIERAGIASEKNLLALFGDTYNEYSSVFDDWYEETGRVLLNQFYPFVKFDEQHGRFYISEAGTNNYQNGDELLAALRKTLDRHSSSVLRRSQSRQITPEAIANPHDYYRLGKMAGMAYPNIPNSIDDADPFIISALRIDRQTLRQALGIVDDDSYDLPYVFPEEANLTRIVEKYQNLLQVKSPVYPPAIVALLQKPERVLDIFIDIAEGNLHSRGTNILLERDNRTFQVGTGTADGDYLQETAKQIALYEMSNDGTPIPPRSHHQITNSEEFIRKVENSPFLEPLKDTLNWNMWRALMRGLLLDR